MTYYGPQRLPEAAFRALPSIAVPLPIMGMGTEPRRRRVFVCPHVTINGEQWTPSDVRLSMKDTLRGDKAEIRCDVRPSVTIKNDYAEDVCLSSWGRTCPFLPARKAA